MKYRLLAISASAMSLILTAPIAAPQSVTGVVNVHGFVAPRCGSTYAGDSTFSGTINLGELTQTNGTLSPTLAGSTENGPAGIATFLVGCTGGGANVTLSATRLTNPLAPELTTSSNDIDFTVQTKIALGVGGFAKVDYTTGPTLPPPTTALIPDFFANVPGNFEVRVFGFSAENGASSLLVAGSYDAVITITVCPAS